MSLRIRSFAALRRFLPIAAALSAGAGQADPIAMPTGSTVWMHYEASPCPDADGDDCVGSNLPGAAPPNGIPLMSFGTTGNISTAYAEILPAQVRTFNRGRFTSFMRASFQDTYTVHGSAVGTFPITVTISASGIARTVEVLATSHRLASAAVQLEIGTFNPSDVAILEQFRVTPFGSDTLGTHSFPLTVVAAPTTIPISVSASHTRTVRVGEVFDLAYGINSTLATGELDLTDNGAQISFTLPEGVWLTSSLGGMWGTAPAPVPVGPWVPLGVTIGLLTVALRSRPRGRERSAIPLSAKRPSR